MGLFDIFARKGSAGALRKHAARAANKRAQNPDRWESIQALAAMRSPEAVEALLQRFAIRVDPSIVDQEEKDAAFHGIVDAGEVAVEPVRKFMREADSISWPLKILEALVPTEEVVGELLAVLSTMDTEYERDPQKKIQVVQFLEDRQDERIAGAVLPFLEDMNETVRFHVVGAIWAQADPEPCRDPLLDLLGDEESVRCRAAILDGFAEREWALPEDRRPSLQPQLPDGYVLDNDGTVRKK